MLAFSSVSVRHQPLPPHAVPIAIFGTAPAPFSGELIRVRVEGVRQVWDTDPAHPFTVVDVRVPLVNALPFSVRREELHSLSIFYALEM